jgi:hypothetical protein
VPLQGLAHRPIDASCRSFLGDDAVEMCLGSGASAQHIADHHERGNVHLLERGGRIAGLVILVGATSDLIMVDIDLHREGLGRVLWRGAEVIMAGGCRLGEALPGTRRTPRAPVIA